MVLRKGEKALFACVASVAAILFVMRPVTGQQKDAAKKSQVQMFSHEQWAKVLVERLNFKHDPQALAMAEEEVYKLLSGEGEGKIGAATYKKSLFPARVYQSDDLQKKDQKWVEAVGTPTTLYYFLPLPVTGKFSLKVKVKGPAKQYWNFQGEDNIRTVTTSKNFTEQQIGPFSLNAGIKRLGVSLPIGSAVQQVSYVGPCGPAIQPSQGWQGKQKIAYPQMVRTMLMAYANVLEEKMKKRLPPDRKVPGRKFGPESYTTDADGKNSSLYSFRLPEEGIYSIYSEGAKSGQRSWVINDCGMIDKAAEVDEKGKPIRGRRHVTTQFFKAGQQKLKVTSTEGIVSDTLIIIRRDDRPKILLELAEELGLPKDQQAFLALLNDGGIDDFFTPFDALNDDEDDEGQATPLPIPTGGPGSDDDDPFKDDDRGGESPVLP